MNRRQTLGRTALTACAASLTVIAGVQAWQPAEGEPVRCDMVLTSAEATAIAGDGYEGPAVTARRPGFTECVWQGNDTTISVAFRTLTDLKADDRKPEDEFEMDVAAVEDGPRKREDLKDIGKRAAIVVVEGDAFLVEVLRPDGVARMITYKVPRETAIALGRAIATP
jgi:hypothetical protein